MTPRSPRSSVHSRSLPKFLHISLQTMTTDIYTDDRNGSDQTARMDADLDSGCSFMT